MAFSRYRSTDWGIQSLKPNPNGKRYMVRYTAMQHLAVRVTENGTKSFVVVARKAGQKHPHFEVLGRYPSLPREQVPAFSPCLPIKAVSGAAPGPYSDAGFLGSVVPRD